MKWKNGWNLPIWPVKKTIKTAKVFKLELSRLWQWYYVLVFCNFVIFQKRYPEAEGRAYKRKMVDFLQQYTDEDILAITDDWFDGDDVSNGYKNGKQEKEEVVSYGRWPISSPLEWQSWMGTDSKRAHGSPKCSWGSNSAAETLLALLPS